MSRWPVIMFVLFAACGGCKDEAVDNNGTNNDTSVIEPFVPEACDGDDDLDGDGLTGCDDDDCRLADDCTFVPPDPATVATPSESVGIASFYDRYRFLFEGPNAVQRGVKDGAIDAVTIGALRGLVRTPAGTPLAGVTVTMFDEPELGRTFSRADGRFDFVLDAGRTVFARFEKAGFTPVYRTVVAQQHQQGVVEDVVLTPLHDNATFVDFSETVYVEGSTSEDEHGRRKTALVVPAGVKATMVMPNGYRQPLPTATIRMTEVTEGADGPLAMPGELPGASRYTYAAEFTVDEADAAGAAHVEFDEPVFVYVDNFIGFAPGTPVPSGWFDRANPSWKGAPNGHVLRIAGEANGLATFEADGPLTDDTLAVLGFTENERRLVAQNYAAGDEVWRVPLWHFSAWDLNWAGIFPPGMFAPPGGARGGHGCTGRSETGSIIDCDNQTLGERIPLSGTPFTLVYQSGRVPGRLPTATIPIHQGVLPEGVGGVHVTMDVAGVHFEQEYEAGDDIPAVLEWTWDRHDEYGRFVQGAVDATIVVAYTYDVSYATEPPENDIRVGRSGLSPRRQALEEEQPGDFAEYSTTEGSTVRVGRDVTRISRKEVIPLGGWEVAREDLGGWTLDLQHRFDPNVPSLHFGSGEDFTARAEDRVLERLAGYRRPDAEPAPDGATAKGAWIGLTGDVELDRDGSVYFVSAFSGRPNAIRRIRPDGTLETMAGALDYFDLEESGDGMPGREARFADILELQVAPNGLLHFLTATGVWRLEEDGTVTLVAGNENIDFAVSPRDVLGWEFQFNGLQTTFDVGRDGSIYTHDGSGSVIKITNDGKARRISTMPNKGIIKFIRVKRNDDLVIVHDPTEATDPVPDMELHVLRADGQLQDMADFPIEGVIDVELHPITEEIYVSPIGGSLVGVAVARVIDAQGNLEPVIGRELDPDQRDRNPLDEILDNTRANEQMTPKATFALSPTGAIVFRNGTELIRMREILPTGTGPFQIPSFDGNQVFEFFADGRHKATRGAWTGTVLWNFGYDDAGRLISASDRHQNTTTIERDTDGRPTAIVGPYGVKWSLETDGNGLLTAVTSPESERWEMAYDSGALLTSFTSPTDHNWAFEYDESGRLVRDENASLERVVQGTTQTVTYTSAEGRQTEYARGLTGSSSQSETTGNVRSSSASEDGLNQLRLPDGTVVAQERAVHPLGYIAGYTSFVGMSTPGGTTFEATTVQTADRETDDLFGLVSWDEITETSLGQVTSRWDGPSRTFTTETSGGRSTSGVVDELGRIVSVDAPGQAPQELTYDAQGRPTVVTQSDRTWQLSYDDNGYLAAVETPDGTAMMTRDRMGRITRGTRTDATTVDMSWDGMSNVTAIAPPERPDYNMTYNRRGQATTFAAPNGTYSFDYNGDFQLASVEYPDGRTAAFGHDQNGRTTSVTTPERAVTLGFDDGVAGDFDGSGNLLAAQTDTGVDLEFAYDGFLLTDAVWLGEVTGDVAWRYGEQMRLEAIAVNGVEVPYAYDEDGAVTEAGDQSIAYEDATFRVASRSIGAVDVDMTYTQYGELQTMTTDLLDFAFVYDDLGRLTQVTETDQGTTRTLDYAYDLLGQLTEVRTDGVITATYTYDANGNRLTAPNLTSATYSDSDELLSYDGRTFTYEAGQLTSMTEGATTTTYDYGMFGELLAVDDGTTAIEYEHDAFHRRVAKRVNGATVWGLLYQDQLNPIAELGPDGSVTSRFVYATRAHVPDFMVQGNTTYAILTDHLGSVRYVVNTSDGSIAQRLTYDEFGNVLSDSNPGFQPFGFAGGIYDPDTGLVRFGARDYDASIGRWTARDPIGFSGKQVNLWSYAGNGASYAIDPTGKLANTLVIVVPAMLGGTFNAYEARGQSHEDVARAFVTGAAGGAVAGAGAMLGALGAVAGTGTGAALTKWLDLRYCVDSVDESIEMDVVTTSITAAMAAAIALGLAYGGGGFAIVAALVSRSAQTGPQVARAGLNNLGSNLTVEFWEATIAAVASGTGTVFAYPAAHGLGDW